VLRYLRWTLAGLMTAVLALPWSASACCSEPAKASSTCGDYGTSVHFEKSPSDAARKALKEEKLVMVLHISGNFEDPDLT
jgi:hypothetical protein